MRQSDTEHDKACRETLETAIEMCKRGGHEESCQTLMNMVEQMHDPRLLVLRAEALMVVVSALGDAQHTFEAVMTRLHNFAKCLTHEKCLRAIAFAAQAISHSTEDDQTCAPCAHL